MSSAIDASTLAALAANAARTESPKPGAATPAPAFKTVLVPSCGWPKDAPAPKGRKRAARPKE